MKDGINPGIIELEAMNYTCRAEIPIVLAGEVTSHTPRTHFSVKLNQFPINIANCRTVHKLQGRTLENLVITLWCMSPGWAYVALSRVKSLNGIFLRKPLKEIRSAGLNHDVRKMLETFRRTILVAIDVG